MRDLAAGIDSNVGAMFGKIAAVRLGRMVPTTPTLLLAAFYILVVGALIVSNNYLPFITDNNETFSSLAHASNIYNFGFRGTYGLTDETISPFAEAGPYVYTHMGNFPRFFALLLYSLGARTAEAQIVITAATIGLAGFIVAFKFFSRRVGAAFAAIYCIVFITDYVMVLQWQVVTWQVWRFLFLFLSLVLVELLKEQERPTVLFVAAALLNFSCLNYYDIPFSVFVCAATVIYGITGAQTWWSRFRIVFVVGVGWTIGAIILIAQSVLALGWEVFLGDLRYTYLARNEMASGGAGLKAVTEFYENNHIVFWMNFFDASIFRAPSKFLATLFTYIFSVYTPFITSVALIIGGMTIIAAFDERTSPASDDERNSFFALIAFLIAVAWCGLASILALDAKVNEVLVQSAFVGLAVAILLYDLCFSDAFYARGLSARRLWMGASWLFLVGCIFLVSSTIYNPGLKPLHAEIEGIVGGSLVAGLCLVLALWVGALVLLRGVGPYAAGIRALARLLIAGFFGYVLVMQLSPGYVISTVMSRFTPLTVGFHLILLVLALFGAGYMLSESWREAKDSLRARVVVAGATITLAFFIVVWGTTQTIYASRLPGDTGQVFKALRAEMFQGKSFIVDGYSAPVGITSHSWSYIDTLLWRDRISVGDGGYKVQNDNQYLWFRDRDSNPAYRRPQYFVCLIQRDIYYAVPGANPTGCSARELVSKARSGGNALLAPKEMVRDSSAQDRWSVVRLDWNFPAYLRPSMPGGTFVHIVARTDEQKLGLDASFDLVQRDDDVSGLIYRLYRLDACTGTARVLVGASRKNDLVLKSGADGIYQVGVELLPTRSQLAAEFFSLPLTVKGNDLQECREGLPARPFAFRKVSNGPN